MLSFERKRINTVLDRIVYAIGFISIFIFLARFGFYLNEAWNQYIFTAIQWVVIAFCIQELLRWLTASSVFEHFKDRWFENFIILTIAFYFIQNELINTSIQRIHPNLGLDDITIAYLGFTQFTLILGGFVRFFRGTSLFSKLSLSSSQIFCISFGIPIVIGACLLKLPKATVNGIDWLDAFFTSTSAVCVTGLTVLNTATEFTATGQLIIMTLFQIGGLGIMTLTLAFGILFSGGLGLKERILMSDIFSDDRMGEVGSLLGKITAFTFSVEAIGATLLYMAKGFEFDNLQINELYYAIFHAISAFCNAGFSLYESGLAIETLANNKFYGSSIMILILIGGLGFPVIINLYEALDPRNKQINLIKIPTKLILITTTLLTIFGTLVLFFSEMTASFKGLDWVDQFYHSAFLSVSARTAGFNIWPTESLGLATGLLLIFLMWVGGSPMSTAGGIKNLTFAVALLAIKALVKGKNHIEVFGREIYNHSIFKAFNIIFISIIIIFTGSILLIILEPQASAFDLFFEATSAFSTVGMSRGVTPNLSDPSKMIIIVLMYTGRIGFLTFLSSLFIQVETKNYKLLKENIPIT